ncbi:MAG: RcpC/CpaB family pilus assembly protein [Actinomycetota bacterium]|nr:RcpC/CpaB family pilus assembly protein [Actinomycetota bacterium]
MVIAVVAVLAFILNMLALQNRTATIQVAVAGRSMSEGTALAADAVRFVPVGAGFAGRDSMISEDRLGALEGWVLARSVDEGDLLTVDHVAEPGLPSGLRSMSLPVAPEHAAGGSLTVGDRVDVITVIDGVASFVVTDVEVIAVADTDSGSFSSGGYHIVVGVDAAQALSLAAALESGSLEVIRSTGAPDVDQGVGVDDS